MYSVYIHYLRGVLGLSFKVSTVYVSQIRNNIKSGLKRKQICTACRELILASHSFTRYHLHRRGFVRLINIRKALLTLPLLDQHCSIGLRIFPKLGFVADFLHKYTINLTGRQLYRDGRGWSRSVLLYM
jgi:hypothetical protein